MSNSQKILISKLELVVLLLCSSLLFLLVNAELFVAKLTGNSSESYALFNDRLKDSATSIVSWLVDNVFNATITTLVFWGIIGLICYTIVFFFIDTGEELKNTAKIEITYKHPDNYKRYYSFGVFKNTLKLILFLSVMAVLLYLIVYYFMPYSSTNMLLALYDNNANNIGIATYLLMSITTFISIPILVLLVWRLYKRS